MWEGGNPLKYQKRSFVNSQTKKLLVMASRHTMLTYSSTSMTSWMTSSMSSMTVTIIQPVMGNRDHHLHRRHHHRHHHAFLPIFFLFCLNLFQIVQQVYFQKVIFLLLCLSPHFFYFLLIFSNFLFLFKTCVKSMFSKGDLLTAMPFSPIIIFAFFLNDRCQQPDSQHGR